MENNTLKIKITNIKNKDGSKKSEFLNELLDTHPNMIGECIVNPHVNGYLLLDWNDDSGKMLRTSKIIRLSYNRQDNKIIITTKNSVYECDLLED